MNFYAYLIASLVLHLFMNGHDSETFFSGVHLFQSAVLTLFVCIAYEVASDTLGDIGR